MNARAFKPITYVLSQMSKDISCENRVDTDYDEDDIHWSIQSTSTSTFNWKCPHNMYTFK
ncbi:hypothetical protein GYMLUDRAFT_48043 [Collybiopsis luxurians FD-317 M1]|uniref:Uncharacterized protein n=1 Tax=Collybiopsis luxurians FD-317 M1 TaxID=944289 RepID=A0A0D0CJC3_9AGAR|nr:hypothetical protein GYMLUDRAFT_48043 [Collybiopsis luxurians FD-317 M1]